ncbi:MAG: hypothetical protein CVV37_04150 [Nitrospira bacterium HGW-Nitrospira-1]|nr:MAG: hypothetical protein CVV37_04150 [Nitrospira bacterium HGW-Nitrospira-1]
MALNRGKICKAISFIIVTVFVFSSLFAYLFYLDLKKTFIVRLSGKASSLVGQRIDISDISFSLSSGINIYDIQIQNPQGFVPGRLLQIKRISLDLQYRELLEGKLYFKKVVLYAPELAVMKDHEGKFNVSDEFRRFLSKKSALNYRIDEFRILSGMADYNHDIRMRNDKINLTLKNLSSHPGTKTIIEGDTLWSGENRVRVNGWANLKDEPKKFKLSVSAEDFSLSQFRTILAKHQIDAGKTRVSMALDAEGDTDNGVNLTSMVQIKSPGYDIYKKAMLNIRLDADVFYDFSAGSASINALSVKIGDASALKLKGRLMNLEKNPSYDLKIKLDSLDLSAFNIVRGFKTSGILTSNAINIKGRFDHPMPEVNGSIQMDGVSVASDTVDVKGMKGRLIFSSADNITARIEASAEMRYNDYSFKKLTCGLGFNYGHGSIAIKNPKVETEDFSSSADLIKIRTTGRRGSLLIDVKNLSAAYPVKKAGIHGLDFSLTLNTAAKNSSGDITFSTGEVMFQEVKSKKISGSGKFNESEFSLAIPQAEFAGGRVRVIAQGKTPQEPFPVKAEITAEHIDLGVISLAAEKFSETGYRISGNLESSTFKGTIDSKESLHGEAAIDLEKFSVISKKTNQSLLKDASMRSEITLQGKDCAFKAALSAGSVAATVSGAATEFMGDKRTVSIHGHLKETPAMEIRNSFWEMFPDSLLYAGMDGSVSSDVTLDYRKDGVTFAGSLRLKDFLLEGENAEYAVGPVNGVIPFAYGRFDDGKKPIALPAFERSEFAGISRYYADASPGDDYSRITIGSLQYGFRLLRDLNVWIKQDGGILNVARFSADIFGGRLNGSAVVDIADGFHYRAGMILEGLSLTRLCDDIEPVKGYLSGKVDAIGILKGSGAGLSELIGRGDFWTYTAKGEKTRISREFLQKIGGPSIKSYLGDRNFDKGVINLYIQKGVLIFRELEISNRNMFGIQNLAVKVAPLSNRIAIDHLMWTIVEAAHRAKKK